MIYVPKAKAGARKQPITQHLTDFLAEYVKAAEKGQVWLFPSNRCNGQHMKWIEKAFRRVVAAADLDPKQILRHTPRHMRLTQQIGDDESGSARILLPH